MKRVLVCLILLRGALSPISAQVTVANEQGINTAFQEYSPAFYRDGLTFIAANPLVAKDKKEDAQVGKYTTSIFLAKRGKDGKLQRPVSFAEELTTKFYDGPLCFNAEGTVVYFTRTNLKRGKPKAGKDNRAHLKIYTSKLQANNTWSEPTELAFNSDDYDCMHPSISADGRRLFFASNRPSGQGGLDIYVCVSMGGAWSEPSNLGSKINTKSDDAFPFIHTDGTLYFSTKGRKAIGGFDIFHTKAGTDGWLDPVVLPEPMNSPSDDFGLIVSTDKAYGFFASNRASGQGDDDIFAFNTTKGIDAELIIKKLDEDFDDKQLTEGVDAIEDQAVSKIEKTVVIADAVVGKTPIDEKIETPKIELLAAIRTDSTQNSKPKTQKSENTEGGKKAEIAVKPTVEKVKKEAAKPTKAETGKKINVVLSTADKSTHSSALGQVQITVFDLKKNADAVVVTDASGKVSGLRNKNGEEIKLEDCPKQIEKSNSIGISTLALIEGNRYLFTFDKEGFEPKYILKTIFSNENKVVAQMLKAKQSVILTEKSVVAKKDTLPNEATNTRSDDFEESKTDKASVPNQPVQPTSTKEGFSFDLKNVYYQYGDIEINKAAQEELLTLAAMMKTQTEIEIEVASHTDSRGNAPYNVSLSQLRAETLKTFLVENGIDGNRIKAKGYGESQLRNQCADGVNCSDEQHATNRRTEIRVLRGADAQTIVQKAPPIQRITATTYTEGGNMMADASNNVAADLAIASSQNAYPLSRKNRFLVIIGTYTRPENAVKQQKRAVGMGYVETEVVQYQDTFLYGVCIRKCSDAKEAQSLVQAINGQQEFEAFVKELK